ncbi:hypothetical protein U9M48_037254 [Paspalum notatum var. saurae]|uniref:Uncharacterized protein n=1 Tax=Paspalum notatum var. saurae TaxID=547442 RepID=A0AAQ3UFL1_PASNO
MARELDGALCLTPARPPPTEAIGSNENVPPDGASDAARSIPARTEAGAASRPPLRAIQPPSRRRWPVPTPKKGLGARAAAKTPMRLGAESPFLGPTKSLRKAVASSTQVSGSNVQEAILLWEKNRNVQNVLSIFQQDDSHAPAKVENCSDELFMRNSEDIICLQMELDIIKTVLFEEIKAHAEANVRITSDDKLKTEDLHILEACRQKEAIEKKLIMEKDVTELLESELLFKINESNELKNNFKSLFLKKELKNKLKRSQVSLQKERNLNTRYQRDQAEKDEVRVQAENEIAKVIVSKEEEICQLQSQLDQSKRCYEGRLKELEIKIQEMDDKIAALVISWNKEKEIAEQRKTHVEKKNEEIKLLERSVEDLEITVCSLENKQSSPEDIMADSPYSTRHPSYIENELLGYKESRRTGSKEVSEQESEISWSDQAGPISSVITHGCNMGMVPPFEEPIQGSHANSSSDIFKEAADVFHPDSHPLPHITNQIKPNSNAIAEAAELAVEPALVEHTKEPCESSGQYMQDAGQSDVEVTEVHSSDKDYWLESSELEEPSASEQQVQSSANKCPELYANGADTDQSLPELESEVQVLPSIVTVEPVVEVLKENELPPVASVRPNDPVNYMGAPSDELKKLRSRNHYKGPRTATDRRFWSIEQQDLYNSMYHGSKVFDMKWIDWEYINSKKQFAGVREQFANLGLEQIMSYRCDWDNELIKQFYSTVHITADKSSMTWMTNGRMITTNKRAWEEKFGIPIGVHTEIHSQFLLEDDDKRILYTSAKSLTPLASIANKILRMTIYPRSGSSIYTHNWNILCHIVEQHPFDVIALIFGEIGLLISDRSRAKDLLLYAPYIMGMILRAFEYKGPRETRHHLYKPRNTDNPKQTKKVSRPAACAVAAAFERPCSAFQPEVPAAGHDACGEVVDGHHQFEAARHQPQAEAVQGQQTVPAQPITRTDLLQVVEDGLRPIRVSLTNMEGRICRVEGGATPPLQHTNSSSSSQIPRPTVPPAEGGASLAPPFLQATKHRVWLQQFLLNRPARCMQPALVRPSPFSHFPWEGAEKSLTYASAVDVIET